MGFVRDIGRDWGFDFGSDLGLRAIAHLACWSRAGLAALLLFAFADMAAAAEPGAAAPVRVAVYDAEPYGGKGPDGLYVGASVDLWRRVAEHLNWQYQLTLVPQMGDLLSGLEDGSYDVAIGAVTITPERLARVDFSYPTHRSGVAAAFTRRTGADAALHQYGAAVGELGPLLIALLVFLTVTGVLMWAFERSPWKNHDKSGSQASVASWHEGIYWAVVTMTTVGYGDKTPQTHLGRGLAVVSMLGSVVLVSLLTTNLVARMTANQVEGTAIRVSDLAGKRLAAVSDSSGAEYLDNQRFTYNKFGNLPDAPERGGVGPGGCRREQRRRATVSGEHAFFRLDRGAERPAGPGLHGLRPAEELKPEKAARPGARDSHREHGVAIGRRHLLRPVTGHVAASARFMSSDLPVVPMCRRLLRL